MAGIIIRSTSVEIYYITTRRSNHMKLMDKAKQAALVAAVKTGLGYLEKDPEVNIPKLMELVDKVVPDAGMRHREMQSVMQSRIKTATGIN